MVIDFSWGWVKPGPVVMTEPLANTSLELAQAVMPQATLHPAVVSRPVPETREQGSQQRRRVPEFPE